MRRPAARDDSGQAVVLAVCAIAAAALLALVLGGFGGTLTAKAARQRATDLAAICAAQAMREAYPRLFASARPRFGSGQRSRPAGSVAPLTRSGYLGVAARAAEGCAVANGLEDPVEVRFAGPRSTAPLAVSVSARGAERIAVGERSGRIWVRTRATAEMAPAALPAASASSGEYAGPFAHRQGKPMRPDVAQAFDRMAAAARDEAGIALVITSAFRSDSEQAQLFAQHPDPRWVARPGTSLHRLGTELDLGPQSAYGWLAANAQRFGFTQRYSWEPWQQGTPKLTSRRLAIRATLADEVSGAA